MPLAAILDPDGLGVAAKVDAYAEPLGGEEAAVAGDDDDAGIDQDRGIEAEPLDRRRDLSDLRFGVLAGPADILKSTEYRVARSSWP